MAQNVQSLETNVSGEENETVREPPSQESKSSDTLDPFSPVGLGLQKQRIFKIIVIGDSDVGKTCLTFRFCQDKFPERSEATIGVDFREKNVKVGDEWLKLQIWDTAGQERFRKSMVQHYYRNVHAVVFVYDVTKLSSFESLPDWIAECDRHNLGPDVPRILVGNKCDVHDEIVVSTNDAQRYADHHRMPLFETSAKDNNSSDHVESIFLTIAHKLKNCRSMSMPASSSFDQSNAGSSSRELDDVIPSPISLSQSRFDPPPRHPPSGDTCLC